LGGSLPSKKSLKAEDWRCRNQHSGWAGVGRCGGISILNTECIFT